MSAFKRVVSMTLLFCILLPLISCSSGNKRIYISLESMPQTLDPQAAGSDSELLVARNIYEGLTRRDKDGNIVLAAAESYDYSSLKYTFTLRDDLKWEDGKPLTADDFVFGLKRALLPETQAPFARLLYAVKGAKKVNTGKASVDTLGINAPDSKTVKIILTKDDKDFLETLSMPVSMPCREEFFKDSIGKYGLEKDCVLSCGSYKLARWNKSENGIRLYVNEEYTGAFKPKNDGLFIAKDKEKTVSEKLISGDSDMALLSAKYLPDIKDTDIKTVSVQNICWVLSLGGEFNSNVRRALCTCFSSETYSDSLPEGFSVASSIYPDVLGVKVKAKTQKYNPDYARELISNEVKEYQSKKFPQTVLIYTDSESMQPAITKIVGDWQKHLSAFINIKPTDKSLEGELKDHTLSLSVFPVKANSTIGEYLYKFGIKNSNPAKAQTEALDKYNLLPVAFENTVFGYNKNVSEVYINATGGYVDFSYIVKK